MKDIPAHIRKAILERAGGPYCENIVNGTRCLRSAVWGGGRHHKRFRSMGGGHDLANLLLLCSRCHRIQHRLIK